MKTNPINLEAGDKTADSRGKLKAVRDVEVNGLWLTIYFTDGTCHEVPTTDQIEYQPAVEIHPKVYR